MSHPHNNIYFDDNVARRRFIISILTAMHDVYGDQLRKDLLAEWYFIHHTPEDYEALIQSLFGLLYASFHSTAAASHMPCTALFTDFALAHEFYNSEHEGQ